MKIGVCVKQVPSKEAILRLNEDSTWLRESELSYEMNEPDAYALEEALQLKESHGGDVVVLSVGPSRVQSVLREALAKGADRAIHIEVTEPTFLLHSAYVSRLMAEALCAEAPDLVLTGLQSDDFGMAQCGVMLAEWLGLPHATLVMQVELHGASLRVKREWEDGWFQWVELPLPAVLTIQSGIRKLRYATLLGIKRSKTKEIRHLTPAELNVSPESAGPFPRLLRLDLPRKTKKTEFLDGSPQQVAAQLVERLRRHAGVL